MDEEEDEEVVEGSEAFAVEGTAVVVFVAALGGLVAVVAFVTGDCFGI